MFEVLGLTVTEELSWDINTASVADKAQQRLYRPEEVEEGEAIAETAGKFLLVCHQEHVDLLRGSAAA